MSEQASASPAPSESAQPEISSENAEVLEASPESSELSPEAAIKEAAANGEITKQEANKLIKEFKLKVNGKEITKSYDLSDEDFLKNQFQLAEAAKKSMQDSAELKKLYNKEVERLTKDPWAVLKELGMDPDELAEMRLRQRVEEMKKSPEQLEKEKIHKELQEAREEARKLKEEKESLEMTKLRAESAEKLETEIMSALSAHKTLPQSNYVVKRIADSMLWAMNNGFEDVSADDVVPMVEKEMRDELNKFMDEMPEDLMEKYIGQRNIERMRKRRIAQTKVPSASQIKPTTQAIKKELETQQAPAQKILAKDFFKNLGKK